MIADSIVDQNQQITELKLQLQNAISTHSKSAHFMKHWAEKFSYDVFDDCSKLWDNQLAAHNLIGNISYNIQGYDDSQLANARKAFQNRRLQRGIIRDNLNILKEGIYIKAS